MRWYRSIRKMTTLYIQPEGNMVEVCSSASVISLRHGSWEHIPTIISMTVRRCTFWITTLMAAVPIGTRKKATDIFCTTWKMVCTVWRLRYRKTGFVSTIVGEYLYTKYQSGSIYYDHSSEISNHIGGRDDYYNHYEYVGWQHWGQVIGNPLYLSPVYNKDGSLYIKEQPFCGMAFRHQRWTAGTFTLSCADDMAERLGTWICLMRMYRRL